MPPCAFLTCFPFTVFIFTLTSLSCVSMVSVPGPALTHLGSPQETHFFIQASLDCMAGQPVESNLPFLLSLVAN
jgi:hypothetical protein